MYFALDFILPRPFQDLAKVTWCQWTTAFTQMELAKKAYIAKCHVPPLTSRTTRQTTHVTSDLHLADIILATQAAGYSCTFDRRLWI